MRGNQAHLLNNLDLSVESRSPAFNQRHIGGQTHAVHMAARIEVVQGIKHDIERREPVDIKAAILDIVMIRLELRARLKLVRDVFRHLYRE